jgi:DNA polymerase-3 subunit gamma/tau
MREIHLEERPVNFKQVVGQRGACAQLIALNKSEEGIPHCLLFSGPSGCGKTTLARIVRRKLKCSDADFFEINAARKRGIDMVRDIQGSVSLAPMDGEARVWLIDECHQLTGEAQGAFLKLLEEPPDHVYFMLATTDPHKLRKTIRTRCTEITVQSLTIKDLTSLVNRVAEERTGEPMEDEVVGKLTDIADGSARKALVLLQQIIGIESHDDQMAVLEKADIKVAAFKIARAIMGRKGWKVIGEMVRNCDEDPEGIRRMMLSYFSKVVLGGGKNTGFGIKIMEEFEDNYFDTNKPGLVMSCYRASTRS